MSTCAAMFFGLLCLFLGCNVVDVAKAKSKSGNQNEGVQWYTEQLANLASKYMKGADKMAANVENQIKTFARKFMGFSEKTEGTSGVKSKSPRFIKETKVECKPKSMSTCAADLYSIIMEFFREKYPQRYLNTLTCKIDECRQIVTAKRAQKAKPADDKPTNMFDLFAQINKVYENMMKGQPFDIEATVALITKLFDYLVANPGMESMFLTMIDQVGYDQTMKSAVKSMVKWMVDMYRKVKKSGDIMVVFREIGNYISLDDLMNKNYLKAIAQMISSNSAGRQNDIWKNHDFIHATIDFISSLAAHIKAVNIKNLRSKGSFTSQLEYMAEVMLAYPWNALKSTLQIYKSLPDSIETLKTAISSLIEGGTAEESKIFAELDMKLLDIIQLFDFVAEALDKQGTEFGPNVAAELQAIAMKLFVLAQDIKGILGTFDEVAVANEAASEKLKKDLGNFAGSVTAELNRWEIVKKAIDDLSSMERFDGPTFLKYMRAYLQGIPKYADLVKSYDKFIAELRKVNWDQFKNVKKLGGHSYDK